MLDSFEGGEAYRLAVYGLDVRGLPVRNLIRHKHEYPTQQDSSWSLQSGRPAGTDPANQAYDDDYELRRARTPIPTFFADAIKRHLGKIYTQEVSRETTNKALEEWWEDVDGQMTSIDNWMAVTVAPLLLVLGHIDILLEPPSAPEGDMVASKADELRFHLNSCIASHVLPENLPWWKIGRDGQYIECVVREVGDDGSVKYRYWNKEIWQEYAGDGKPARTGFREFDMQGNPTGPEKPLEYGMVNQSYGQAKPPVEHGYGLVPIIRLFDRRRPRERHCGLPRYEPLAEIQREYYNRDSESVLADTTHVHPLLHGPEDYVRGDGLIPVGPNWLLPDKKVQIGSSIFYQPFGVIEFPTAGMESLRQNKAELRDQADRASLLTKPAGASGTTANTVAQSGIAKSIDASEGHDLLAEIAEVLMRAEYRISELAATIMRALKPDERIDETTRICYPKKFCLLSAQEILDGTIGWQAAREGSGETPIVDSALLRQIVRRLLQGLDDDEYKTMDDEIEEMLADKVKRIKEMRESSAESLQLESPNDKPVSIGNEEGMGGQPEEPDMAASESTARESPNNAVGSHTQ